jgi:hypothetical protein
MTFKQRVLVWYFTRGMRFWHWLAKHLPKALAYQCAVYVIAMATSKPGYKITGDVGRFPVMTALERFARYYGIPGHGKDNLYDSNARFYKQQ